MSRALALVGLLALCCGGATTRDGGTGTGPLPRPEAPGCYSFDAALAARMAEDIRAKCDPANPDVEPFVCRGPDDPGFECIWLLQECSTPDCSAPDDLIWRCCNITRPLQRG